MAPRLAHIPVAALLVLAACQPSYTPDRTVTLTDGEVCSVVGQSEAGTNLTCPSRGAITVATPTRTEPVLRVTDIPGVPSIPSIPQTEAEALCRAGQYAQGRVRGAAEGAALNAVGLPGNLFGIWRRSQDIARRIEGRPGPAAPCAGL